MKKAALAVMAAVALLVPATAAEAKSCKPVVNVPALDGSRYEGSDVFRIRARATSCRTARRVAVRATLRGMFLGAHVQTYRWRVWLVERDLSGPADDYLATAGQEKRVTWRFGSL